MTRRLTFILVAINLALAAVLAWQWLSPAGQRSTRWTVPQPVVPQLGAGSVGMQPGQETDGGRLAAVLERPVFAVTRRPVPPATVAAAAPVAPPPDPLDGVHIFGMFSGSDGGGVIVRADGKTRRLKVSESVGEWRLKEVRGNDAVFVRSGQTRVVSLVQARQGVAGAASPARAGRPPVPGVTAPPPSPDSASSSDAPPSSEPTSASEPPPSSDPGTAAAPAAQPPARSPSGRSSATPSSPFVIGGSR